MDALEIIYMNNNCAKSSSTLCNQIRSAVDTYATKREFPTLGNIPGSLDTLKNEPTYYAHPRPEVINNIKNEMTDADIALAQYRAQLEAANKCRGTPECDVEYRKATEELAKAQNRKTNAQKLLDEYHVSGILPSESESVGNGSGHASDVGDAKAEDYVTMTSSTAASETSLSASSTFAAKGIGEVNHKTLDADSMNITTSAGFAGQLVMKAIGTVGRGLVLCNNALMQAEVMAFVAGAVIYIMAEISAFSEFKKIQSDLKEALEIIKKNKGAQKEAFYKLLQTYQNMMSAAQKKKQGQSAASTAFFAAAAIAAGKYGILIAGRATCVSACSAATATWSACCGPHSPGCCVKAGLCSTATGVASARTGFLSGNDVAAVISSTKFASTLAAETSAQAGIAVCSECSAGCAPSFLTEKSSWVACPPVPSIAKDFRFDEWNRFFVSNGVKVRLNIKAQVHQADKVLALKKAGASAKTIASSCSAPPAYYEEENFSDLSQKILNYLIPQAKAFDSALLGLGGVAMSMLSGLILTEWSIFDAWIHGPLGRSIVFSLAGAFAAMEAQNTGKMITKIESRLGLVRSIIARMEAEEVAQLMASLQAQTASLTSSAAPYMVSSLSAPAPLPMRIPCVVKDNVNPKSGKCGSILSSFNTASDINYNAGSSKTSQFKDTKGISLGSINDKPLNLMIQSAAGVADSIQGSDSSVLSEASLKSVGALASKQSFAESSLRDAEAEINKTLKAGKQKQISFDSLKASAMASLQRAALAEAKKRNMTLEEAASNFGVQLPDTDGTESTKTASALGQNDFAKVQISALPDFKALNLNEQQKTTTQNDMTASEVEESFKQRAAGKDVSAAPTPVAEIVDRPETSIFQIISVRYLKTGLTRLGFGKAAKAETTNKTSKEK